VIATVSAIIFTILIGIVVLFQLGLASGMLWGEATMGGKYPGKLPPSIRTVSVFSAFILAFLTIIVLIKAEVMLTELQSFSSAAIWFVVGFSTIATILNIITRSKIERKLWAPTTVLLLITSTIVALN